MTSPCASSYLGAKQTCQGKSKLQILKIIGSYFNHQSNKHITLSSAAALKKATHSYGFASENASANSKENVLGGVTFGNHAQDPYQNNNKY